MSTINETFLDFPGLETYDGKIKNYFKTKGVKSITEQQIVDLFKSNGNVVLSKNIIDIETGDTDTITLSGATGTVTVASADDAIATVSLSGDTITVTGVAVGNTTVTVNVAASEQYKAATKIVNTIIETAIPLGWSKSTVLQRLPDVFDSYKYSIYAFSLNNDVYILANNYFYKWNKETNTWISVSEPPYAFSDGAAVVYNNEIHILGGGTNQSSNKHYKFNSTTNEWTEVSTDMPVDGLASKAVVYNNEIHILGGWYYWLKHYAWNPNNGWHEVSTLPYTFCYGEAVVYNNEIHILGSANNDDPTQNNLHYKYNGTQWIKVSDIPDINSSGINRSDCVVYNGCIHLIGGNHYSRKHIKWNGSSWSTVVEDFINLFDNPKAFGLTNSCNDAIIINNAIHIFVMKEYDSTSLTNSNNNHYIYKEEIKATTIGEMNNINPSYASDILITDKGDYFVKIGVGHTEDGGSSYSVFRKFGSNREGNYEPFMNYYDQIDFIKNNNNLPSELSSIAYTVTKSSYYTGTETIDGVEYSNSDSTITSKMFLLSLDEIGYSDLTNTYNVFNNGYNSNNLDFRITYDNSHVTTASYFLRGTIDNKIAKASDGEVFGSSGGNVGLKTPRVMYCVVIPNSTPVYYTGTGNEYRISIT